MFSKFLLLVLAIALINVVFSLPIQTEEVKTNEKNDEGKDVEKKEEDKPKITQKSYKYSYYREYGDKDEDNKKDKGFMRRTDEGGSKGYKNFDTFEKKGGDKYEFQSHTEFKKESDSEKDSRKDQGQQKGDIEPMQAAESNNYYSFAHGWDIDHEIPHFDIDWEHFFDHDHGHDVPDHDHEEHDHPDDEAHQDHPDHEDHHEEIIEGHDHHDFFHDIEFDPDPTFDHIPEHIDENSKDGNGESSKDAEKDASADHH